MEEKKNERNGENRLGKEEREMKKEPGERKERGDNPKGCSYEEGKK